MATTPFIIGRIRLVGGILLVGGIHFAYDLDLEVTAS